MAPRRYSRLRARLSKLHRKLKGDFSCTEAHLIEARRRTTNNHTYKTPGTWISETPSLVYVISDAMDTPIGTPAEIFSVYLPNELWTMIFKNLSQHDLSLCLRVSHKVCTLSCSSSVEQANKS